MYDDNGGAGSEAKSISLPGGWTGDVHVSAWSTMPRGYSYRFKVVNTDGKNSQLITFKFGMIDLFFKDKKVYHS